MQKKDQYERGTIPIIPEFFTKQRILEIEKCIGSKIDNIAVLNSDRVRIAYKGDDVIDKMTNIFRKIAEHFFADGKPKLAKGKRYLQLKKEGKSHEESISIANQERQKADQEKAEFPIISTEPSSITSQFVKNIEKEKKRNIEEISVTDEEKITFTVAGQTYQDRCSALFVRISKRYFNSEKAVLGRKYLAGIRDGLTHERSLEHVKNQSKSSPLPVNEEFLNDAIIMKIEKSINQSIETASVMNEAEIRIESEEGTYVDTLQAFLRRIAKNLLNSSSRELAREYLLARKNGLTKKESILQAEQKKPLPLDIENINSDFIACIEKAYESPVENIAIVGNHIEKQFQIGNQMYTDTFSRFLERLAKILFLSISKRSDAKKYLILRKVGFQHDEAMRRIQNSGELLYEKIQELKIAELFSIFADRPGQLKLYLRANYPKMTEQEIDRLILQGFKSFFGASRSKDAEYLEYEECLPAIRLKKQFPEQTNKSSVLIEGFAKGAQCIYISGVGSRRCKVDDNGKFEVTIPLRIGKENELFLTAVQPAKKQRSPLLVATVDQYGEVDDVGQLIDLLSTMGREAMDSIRADPGKYEHIKSRLKHVLIRKFSKNFDEGERYIRSVIDGNHSRVIKKMLREILAEFRATDRTEFPNIRPEEPLYLFQKYCALLIQQRMGEGKPGVILANDPGLGKTRTALAAINGEDSVIVAPNSVVSGWSEEAAKCLRNPDLLVMQDMPHAKRKQVLRESEARHRITNIQFMQKHLDDERFELLADEDTVVVQDESHSRANLESDQTKGMRKLSKRAKFQLLLSATPFKNSKTVRRVLHTLYPDRKEFSSDAAFAKAFPSNDPKALQTLNLLLEEDMIRFTKRDALEEMDPKVPVAKQIHKLPRKEHIEPEKDGEFEMSYAQAEVIYEMFLSRHKWTKKYGKYVPKDKAAKLDHIRKKDVLSKRHAYRQVANNPDYVGLDGVSNAKARKVQSLVEKSLREGRKVEIFCAYNSQANLYAEILKKHHPALYTGITSEEGWKKKDGKPMFFRKDDQGRWEFDDYGYPVEDPNGEAMLAMDYERLSFQNAPERKVVIATYAAGAVGTTFTAAKTVIKDDLPRDCIEEEQSDDRTHRIDHEHQTHHTIKYYNLISRYPEKFLNDMEKKWVVKHGDGTYKEYANRDLAKKAADRLEETAQTAYEAFFEQGTWDEVHYENLKIQRQMMHLILDGIADETVLNEGQKKVKGVDD